MVARKTTRLLFSALTLLICGCTPSLSHSLNAPLQPASFRDFEDWDNGQAEAVQPALLNSCQKLDRRRFDGHSQWGSYRQWQSLCGELSTIDSSNLKTFFEERFKVYRVAPEQPGLFTGYFSPVYEGRLQKEPGFEVPLLKKPKDLVKVSPSDFGNTGPALVGKLKDSSLKPYDTRATIEQKIKNGQINHNQVLVWLKNSKDKFFLQIQGSGNIQLKDGSILHAAYAGNNGHSYVAIGRILKKRGDLKEVTMGTIEAWLDANPDKQQALFNQNPRYIFFRKANVGAVTAQGVPAIAHRTLAVDPDYIPYGVPVWLETRLTESEQPYRKMMVAQDTGSAIKGPVRGDIYMGVGPEAQKLAGPQQSPGKLYVLVPK